MSRCIAGLQYLPSVEFFAHWLHCEALLVEKYEHYQKRTWRNKTGILGQQGLQLLSIPLQKGKNQHMPITDVKIAYDTSWERNHMHSIRTAYGKTAFFNEFENDIESIYKNKYTFLWDLNLQFMQWVTSYFPGEWKIEYTQTYQAIPSSEISDLRHGIPAGIASVGAARIPEYEQIHRFSNSHLPNLSILDVLCHLGPGTMDYLNRYAHALYG